jgi:hypothetical protein
MASLKDTVVSGSLRATDTIYSTTNQFQILRIPTSSNGTTYGPGTNGQILKSNGTSVYWASDSNSDTKVTQAATITTAGAYPIILAHSTATTAVTDTVNKTSTLTYNPNTKSLVTGGTVDGYTLAAASAKSVTDSSSASAISTGTSLPTERDIYYGLPTINNAHNYTSNTKIYAPTDGGTKGQFLVAEGSTSTPTWKDLHYTDLKPIIKKTYASTDYYATAANNDNACFFFMSIKPDSWQKPWTVRFKVHTYCPNSTYVNNHSVTYSTYSGRADSYIVKNWNEVYTSAHYYTSILYLKKAGFDAGLEHAIGINLLYANNYTTAAAYRTFEIEYYECDGCTVTILDSPIKLINWPNYNTTNYNFANNDAVSRGLQESGDASDVSRLMITYPRITTGAVGIGRYTLFMHTSDGTYQSITTTFNNTGTSHVKNTALFRPERIFYRNAGSDLAANNSTNNDNSWMDYTPGGLVDLRYSTNCGSTLQVRKPVYLVGTINDDGFFSLADTWYTQTEPTSDDGKVYIYLGMPYTQDNSSRASSQYRIAFEFNNPIYWYKDGAFRLYEPIPPITRGGTGATSAAGARTNLGLGSIATYNAATAGTKDTWGLVPVIGGTDGVMEIGKYIDFHTTDGNTADYDVRITATTSGLTISGTTNGTFKGNVTGNVSGSAGSVALSGVTGADDLKAIEALSGTSGILKKTAANTWTLDTTAYTTNAGTVTSVRVQATSPVVSSVNTAQSASLNTTISLADGYGDTKNPYASKTKNTVLAAGATANSAPSFRALVAADIPDLSSTYLKLTGGTLTGILNFKNNTVTTLQAESSITDSDYFSTKVYTTQNNDIYTELSIAPLSSDSIHYATKLAISDGTNLTMARLYHSGNIIYSSTAPTDADVIGGLAEGMIWLQPI